MESDSCPGRFCPTWYHSVSCSFDSKGDTLTAGITHGLHRPENDLWTGYLLFPTSERRPQWSEDQWSERSEWSDPSPPAGAFAGWILTWNIWDHLHSSSYTWMLFPPFPAPASTPSDWEEEGRELLERGCPFSPRGVPSRWLIWEAVSSDSQRSSSSRTSRSICSRWISLSRPSLSSWTREKTQAGRAASKLQSKQNPIQPQEILILLGDFHRLKGKQLPRQIVLFPRMKCPGCQLGKQNVYSTWQILAPREITYFFHWPLVSGKREWKGREAAEVR